MSKKELELMVKISKSELEELFKIILDKRIVSRKDIFNEEEASLNNKLEELEGLGLIEKNDAWFEDFDMFYPTAKGLSLERLI